MNERRIKGLALTLALITYALVKYLGGQLAPPPTWALYLLPGVSIATLSTAGQIGAGLLSAMELGALLVISEYLIYRVFIHRFHGRWIYESSTGAYGVADIGITGLWVGSVSLSYDVTLVKSLQGVIDMLDGKLSETPFGTAQGQLFGFKDGKISLTYQVSIGEAVADKGLAATKGILTIAALPHKDFLLGFWESTKKNYESKKEDERRSGKLTFRRPSAVLAQRRIATRG